MKKQKINIIVPALALEHVQNPEFADLRDKIARALQRYHLTGNFMHEGILEAPVPYIFVEKFKLVQEPLGYQVLAKCG